MSKTPTQTQVIHDNQQPNETMSQCVHRNQKAGESMSQAVHDMQEIAVNPPAPTPTPTKPSKPSTPTFTAIAATTATVNWNAPTSGDAPDTYDVIVKAGGTEITGSPFSVASSITTKKITGLTASTEYKITIKATNTVGSSTSTVGTLTTIA